MAALTPWDHVIQAQLGRRELAPAVLALVVVPREDIAPVEFHRLLRQLLVADKPDHARHLDFAADRANPVVIFLAEMPGAVLAHLTPSIEVISCELAVFQAHYFCQFLAQQAEGTTHGN